MIDMRSLKVLYHSHASKQPVLPQRQLMQNAFRLFELNRTTASASAPSGMSKYHMGSLMMQRRPWRSRGLLIISVAVRKRWRPAWRSVTALCEIVSGLFSFWVCWLVQNIYLCFYILTYLCLMGIYCSFRTHVLPCFLLF